MTDLFRKLLKQRGLDESFLVPKYGELFDPYAMKGVTEAVARIKQARDVGEQIVIFGDYDADGVTSSTVLREGLRYFGVADEKIAVMLPNRFKDGFGLKLASVPRIMDAGANLVITVDNGSAAVDVVKELKAQGVDTIITDHHEITEIAPEATAVINPKRADEDEGQGMAGVGVAFTVARALNMERSRENGGEFGCDGQEKWLLDLVAIGTICDVMPMRGPNRILTYYGMKVLAKTKRLGLRELMKVAGANPAELNSQTIGFQLGPRINVAGRLLEAGLAFDLLNAEQRSVAMTLAKQLNDLNNERKGLQDAAIKEAELQLDWRDRVLVVHGKWHEGIVGIVAGRLEDSYKRPAIVLAETEEGILKGSGRSFGEFSLAEALRQLDDLLLTGGGHAAACGLSMEADKFAEFKQRINAYYDSLNLGDQSRFLATATDLVVEDFSELTPEFYAEMEQLEPFGEENAEPVFEISAMVTDVQVMKEKHLALRLTDRQGQTMKFVKFFAPEEWKAAEIGVEAKVQFNLDKNSWGGRTNMEGRIVSLGLGV